MVSTVRLVVVPASNRNTPAALHPPASTEANVPPWANSARPKLHRAVSSRDSYLEVQFTTRTVLGDLRRLRRAGALTERQAEVGRWLVETILTWSRCWDAVDFGPLILELKVSRRTLQRDLEVLEVLGVLQRWHPPGRGYRPIIEFPVPEAGRLAAARAAGRASANDRHTSLTTAPAVASVPEVRTASAPVPPRDSPEFRAGQNLFIGICRVMDLPQNVEADSVRHLFVDLAAAGWTVGDLQEVLMHDGWPKALRGDGIGLLKYRLDRDAAGQRPPRLLREEAAQQRAQQQLQQRRQRELVTRLLAEREEQHRREHYRPVLRELESLSDEQWFELVRPTASLLQNPRRGDVRAEAVAMEALAVRMSHPKWQAPPGWSDRDFDHEAGLAVAVEGLMVEVPDRERGCVPGPGSA